MRKNGFTLIEMMIVMAILGIIASLVMASVKGSKNLSRYTAPPVDSVIVDDAPAVETQAAPAVLPDFSTCDYVGQDAEDRTVHKCLDGKVYTH